MPAGDNERLFRKFMEEKFGAECLRGKQRYTLLLAGFPEASISVDDSIILNDRRVLIEVDSGNMAKLLAGQYALLNGMYDGDKNSSLFLVVHYYRDPKSRALYSRDRTLKNLNAIQHFNAGADWMPFNAFNIEEFEELARETDSLEELVDSVWPNNAN
ncbi:hypothetical protein [Thiomicrorhabdus sp.]|uniref:hypothetical protein n=1 Tax=Thiomicrorhabdus sp. TaxID=2039724 RepID=UPI002AA605D0|nr:hypothetical protein [Thiomicrorhabdus sp.]